MNRYQYEAKLQTNRAAAPANSSKASTKPSVACSKQPKPEFSQQPLSH